MAQDELGPAQHGAHPDTSAGQVDPRTYGTEEGAAAAAERSDAEVASTEIADAKRSGALLQMSAAERQALYARAYGGDEDGVLQNDLSRTALAINEADQDFADPTSVRRAISNGMGPLTTRDEQAEVDALAQVAHDLGLNTFDIGHMTQFNSVAEDGEQAWATALRDDVQLARLSPQQQAMVAETVQQAVQENPSARELMETTDIERSVGLQMALAKKAARMLSRAGRL